MLDYRVYLREEKKHEPRSEWNKFSNVMSFLKTQGVRPGVTKHDWPKYAARSSPSPASDGGG